MADSKKIAREKTAYLYSCAIWDGDTDEIRRILALAELDPELAVILRGLDEARNDEGSSV